MAAGERIVVCTRWTQCVLFVEELLAARNALLDSRTAGGTVAGAAASMSASSSSVASSSSSSPSSAFASSIGSSSDSNGSTVSDRDTREAGESLERDWAFGQYRPIRWVKLSGSTRTGDRAGIVEGFRPGYGNSTNGGGGSGTICGGHDHGTMDDVDDDDDDEDYVEDEDDDDEGVEEEDAEVDDGGSSSSSAASLNAGSRQSSLSTQKPARRRQQPSGQGQRRRRRRQLKIDISTRAANTPESFEQASRALEEAESVDISETRRFEAESRHADVMILSTLCAEGVDLALANRVVLLDVGWNPSHDEQVRLLSYQLFFAFFFFFLSDMFVQTSCQFCYVCDVSYLICSCACPSSSTYHLPLSFFYPSTFSFPSSSSPLFPIFSALPPSSFFLPSSRLRSACTDPRRRVP